MPNPLFPPMSAASSSSPVSLALSADDRRAITRLLQNLVQTSSPSSQEGEVAELIYQHLMAVGVKDVTVDRLGNIIARLGNGEGPTLLFDAHMDTVDAASTGWTHDPLAGAIENGVLYGLGACDMKGSIAALIYAAKRLVESQTQLNGTLLMTFVVQEEPCEGCALKAILAEQGLQPDWVILGEPSNLNIMYGHRGRVLFKVTVHGKSGHAAAPDLGENAIASAARLIFGIELLALDLVSDPVLGPGTIAVTHIESQSASLNAIPDSCTFYVDRRLTLGETPTRAQAQIETIVEREGINAEVEVREYCARSYTGESIQAREAFNAWALDENHFLIQKAGKVVQSILGHPSETGHWAFSTDGAYTMGEAAIPTIGLGPGDPQLVHAVNEQVSLDDVARAAHIYASLASELLK